ncbi:MAG TPA: DUF2520 domain-containing protein [Thermoanaerobaculia bacterium]|nr:DUF2520 domain-containing protein [Thermoanaerobaculia bacterium]
MTRPPFPESPEPELDLEVLRLGIIGGGRAAWSFGRSWLDLGWPISGIALRETSISEIDRLLGVPRSSIADLSRESEVLLFAVPDDVIGPLYEREGEAIPRDEILFHASGSASSTLFHQHPLRFSLHPLRSLSPVGQHPQLAGSLFVFEGAPAGREVSRRFVDGVGAEMAEILASGKGLYHAAAVFASNYVAVLLEIARELFRESGIERPIDEPIGALARSAIENWLRTDDGGRFTGPLTRGDRLVIEAHLAALAALPERDELYRQLGVSLAEILLRDVEDPSSISPLRDLLAGSSRSRS